MEKRKQKQREDAVWRAQKARKYSHRHMNVSYFTDYRCRDRTEEPERHHSHEEIMDIITHHIEHGPESYKSLQDPHRSTVKRIIKRIYQIRNAGFKVSVQMSDHHNSGVQLAAAKEAERKFKRVCHDVRKLAMRKIQPKTPAPTAARVRDEDTVLALPFRLNQLGVR